MQNNEQMIKPYLRIGTVVCSSNEPDELLYGYAMMMAPWTLSHYYYYYYYYTVRSSEFNWRLLSPVRVMFLFSFVQDVVFIYARSTSRVFMQ